MTSGRVTFREAFASKSAEKGAVKFSETKIDDPHVVKLIDHVSKVTGEPASKIKKEIEEKVAEFAGVEKKAPVLYGTIAKNIVESTVFDRVSALEEKGKIHDAPTFNPAVFLKLVKRIKSEHDQFFPLRNFIDHKYLKNERVVIVPSDKKENEHLNSVKTAAATAQGEFAFSKPFMQKLIDFAHVKGVKGKGKKWESNGGDIPDDYAYIEFLIIHEFMHYTYADFHYRKIYKEDPNIINWVGDFRTNYLLVKSGYAQLPMGLFNDDINYDRQKTYKEMIDAVKKEFEKLDDGEKSKVKKQLNDVGDDHSNPGSAPGEPDDGDEAEDGNPTESDVDAKAGEVEGKMAGKKDKGPGEDGDESKSSEDGDKSKSSRGGSGRGSDSIEKFDYRSVKPKYSWQQLLKILLATPEVEQEETYQRPSRSNIRNLHLARQSGAGAVKPGEVSSESDPKAKICFVVDSSGSMTDAVRRVYANIENLLKSHKKSLVKDMFLVKFSAGHKTYRINLGSQTYSEVSGPDDKPSGKMEKGSIKDLFSESFGSSTNFEGGLITDLEKLNSRGYNIILFTDSDILHGSNLDNFFKLYARSKKNLYVIADSKSTYHEMLSNMKQVAKNVTYIDD